jgi:hypothetical protein
MTIRDGEVRHEDELVGRPASSFTGGTGTTHETMLNDRPCWGGGSIGSGREVLSW